MNVNFLTIYTLSSDGDTYAEFLVGGEPVELVEYSYTSERMGATTLTATVRHAECLDTLWTGREFVVLDEGALRSAGVSAVEKFFLAHVPSSSKSNEDARYVHTLEFRASRDILLGGVYFCDAVASGAASASHPVSNSYDVKFVGTLDDFVQRFGDVLSYLGLSGRFSVSLEAGVVGTTESREISFSGATLAEALGQAVEVWGVPFYFLGDSAVFGRADDVPLTAVEYGHDEELLSVSMNNRGEKVVTRIMGAGGTDNVPYYYPNPSPKGTLGVGGTAAGVTIRDMVLFSQAVGQGDVLVYTGKDADFGGVTLNFGGFTAESAPGSPTAVVDGQDHYGVDVLRSIPFDASVTADLSGGFDRGVDVLVTALLGSAEGISPDTELYYVKKMRPFAQMTPDDYVKRLRGEVSSKGWTPLVERVEVVAGGVTVQVTDFEGIYADTGYGEADAGLYPERKLLGVRVDLGEALALLPAGTSLSSCVVRLVGTLRSEVLWQIPDAQGQWHIAEFHVASLSVTGEFDPCGWYNGDTPIGDDLSAVGLSQAGSPVEGTTVTQTVLGYVTPTGRLMPSIYRTSGGAERGYEAEDDTYIDPETGQFYTFENQYDALHPHEHIENFEDVYPSIRNLKDGQGNPLNVLQDVWFDDGYNVRDLLPDGETLKYQYFFVKLKPLGFNLFDCATENGEMAVVMDGGACAGCHFKILVTSDGKNPVQKNSNGTLKKEGASGHQKGVIDPSNIQASQQDTTGNAVWVALYLDGSTFGGGEYGTMPAYDKASGAGAKPVSGDAYVLENIMLPQAFFTAAEQELDRRLIRFMWENNADKFDPAVVFSRIWLAQHPSVRSALSERSRLSLTYDGRVFSPLYVSQFTINVKEGEPLPEILVETADIVEQRTSGLDEKISSAVDAAVNVVMGGAGGGADLEETDRRYLRKDAEDTAQEKIVFSKGLEVGAYKAGLAGIGGTIYTNAAGEAIAEVDFLNVRRKATFTQVEVEQIRKVAGTILLSLADLTVTAVEKVAGGWKCWFRSDAEDGSAIGNAFSAGDQAICRKLQGNDDHYWWRLVTSVGPDWIVVSESDCDAGSDAPMVGDVAVQLGNRSDAARQSAQILSCYGTNSPSYVIYAGIDSYSLAGRDISGFEYRETSSGSGVYQPYFFNYGPMLLGDRNKTQEYIEFDGSALNIKCRLTVLNDQGAYQSLSAYMGTVNQTLIDQQAQIDGQTQTWASGEAATPQTKPYPLWDETTQQIIGTPNYPYTQWADDTERAKHVGDTYVDDTTGQSYRLTKKTTGGTTVYYWTRITDEEVSQAISTAQQAYAAAEGLQYLKSATNEGTLVDGGLVLTSMIQLGYTPQGGSYTVMSGINGKPNEQLQDPAKSIAAWFGGPMVDHETYPSVLDYAKSLFRMDGSGYLAGGNIGWQADGDGHIPGISWETVGGVTSVTIGANVKLEQTGGTDSLVTDLVSAVQSFPTVYLSKTDAATLYHPKGGDTASNTFKIGGATFTWHPAVGTTPGYLELNSAFLTSGDQIVGSGTPGGGGGGAGYLYELGDVYSVNNHVARADGTEKQPGDVLQYYDSTKGWVAAPISTGQTYYRDFGITLNNNAFSVAHDVAAYEDEETITFDPDSHSGVMAENPVEWGAAITYGVNLMVNNTTKGLALASSVVDLWTAVNGKQPAGNYLTSVPLATDSVIGGFQTGFTQSGKNYPVQLSSGKAYVNVPWENTTYGYASADTAGLVKVGGGLTINSSGVLTATATIYTAGSGISISSGTISNTGVLSIGSKTGTITLGSNLSISSSGVLSATDTTYGYASANTAGIIKIGTGLTINDSGVVSVTGQTQGTVTQVKVGSTAYNPDTSGIVSLPAYPTVPTNVSAFTNDAGYITSYTNTWRNVYTGGTSRVGTGTDTKAINFAAGSNVTITYEAAGTGSGQSGSANYFNVKIAASMAFSSLTSHPTTIAGYGITDAKIANGVITLGSNTITPLTSHQTLYNLVINNSAGTAQITYKPGTSGTYSLTLTKAMVGLSNVENTALSTWAGTSNITTLGTITSGTWSGTTIGVTKGGTGKTSIAAFAIIYASAANTYAELAPNTTSTRKFLRMTGTGSAGAAPAWDTVTKTDVGLGNVPNWAVTSIDSTTQNFVN